MKINFVEKQTDILYNPPKKNKTFYQICKFENHDNKICVRKIIINEYGILSNILEKNYDPDKIKKFVTNQKLNKFKIYPTNDLSLVSLPNPNEIFSSISPLLNQDNQFSGFERL